MIRKILDLSTAHFNQATLDLLWAGHHFASLAIQHTIDDDAAYVLLNVPPIAGGDDALLEWPEDLRAAGMKAREFDCDFLKIDRDGDLVDGLEISNDPDDVAVSPSLELALAKLPAAYSDLKVGISIEGATMWVSTVFVGTHVFTRVEADEAATIHYRGRFEPQDAAAAYLGGYEPDTENEPRPDAATD